MDNDISLDLDLIDNDDDLIKDINDLLPPAQDIQLPESSVEGIDDDDFDAEKYIKHQFESVIPEDTTLQKVERRVDIRNDLIRKAKYVNENRRRGEKYSYRGNTSAELGKFVEGNDLLNLSHDEVDELRYAVDGIYSQAVKDRWFGKVFWDAINRSGMKSGHMAVQSLYAIKKADEEEVENLKAMSQAYQEMELYDRPKYIQQVWDVRGVKDAFMWALEATGDNSIHMTATMGAFMIPVVGPYAGIATSMVLNTGEAIGDQIEEDRLHRGYALLQGAGYTAVELATGSEVRAAKALTGGGFRRVAWQATKEIRKEAAQKAAKETFSTTWKEFFKFLVKQGIGEGIEEVVQNNITRAVRAFQTGDYLGPDEHSAWDAAVNDAEEFLSAFVSTIGHSSFSHGHKTRQNIREVRSADEFLSRLGIEKARDAAKALNKYTSAVADITENIKGNADFYTLSPYDRAVLANTLISNAKRSSYASLLDDGPMPEDKSKRISKQLEYIDNIREAALQTMSEDAVELLKTYEEAFSVHGFEILRPQDEGTKPGIITIPVKNKSDFNVQALHESKRQEVNADGTPTGNTIYRDPDSGIAIIESKEGDYTVYNDQGYQMPSERNEFLASEGDALQKALRFAKQLSMFNNKMLEINGQKMQLVRAIANKAYPGVNVAGFEGPVSLPDDVRERFIKQSRGKAMYGFFDDETNTVYVDVRHIRSPIDAAITLFHESLHEGFRNWWSTLNQKEKENYTDGMTDEQFKVFEESLVSGHEASMIMPGSFEDVLGTMVRKFARKVLGANWALSQGEVNLLINRILPHRTTSGEGSFEAHRIVRSEDDSVNWRNVEEKADVDERADTNEAPAPDADVDTDEAPAPKAEPAAEPEADVDADEAPAPEVDAPETKGETDIKIPLEPEGEDGDTAPAAEADESPAPAAETDAKPVKPDEKSESPAQKEREDVTLEDALLVRSSPGDKHYDTINSAEGRPEGSSETFTVITPDGEMEVSGQFDVVDANDFLTGKDAGYYGPFQGRERSSVESQKQVLSIANDPRAIQLDGSPVSDSGSPIVLFKNGSDHVVSGNGRASGLRLAYQVGNAEKYRAHVEQRAKAMGIDTSGMKAPILVRRANDMSLRDGEIFAEKSNADQKLAFTASELAVRDAKVLEDNPQVIRMYNPSDSGNMHAASNHEFLVNFVDKTGDTSLRHQSGKFTDAIEKRVWHALIFRMLGKNTPENRAIITRLAEEAAEYGVVRQVAGLGMAAQTLLDIAANKPDFDLTPALARALEKLLDYKGAIKTGRIKPGTSFAEFSRQLFFDGFDNVSHAEKTAAVLAEILAEAKSVKQIKEFFENYKRITDAVIKKGEGLFAELEVTDTDQTTADALRQARERANGVEEQDIFSFSDGGATEGQKPSDPSTDRSDDSNRQPKQQKPEDPKPKQKPKPVEKPKEKPAKKKAEQPKAEEKPAEKKAKQSTDKDAERKKPPTQAVLDKYAEEFGGGITLRVDGDNVVVEGSTFQNRKELGGRGFFWNPAYKWWQKSVFSFNLDLENQAKREQEKADAQKKFLLDIDMLEENPAGWSLLVPQHLAIAIRKGDKRDIARSIDAGAWIADHGEFTPEQQGAVIDAIMRDEKVSQDIRDFISDEVHGGGKVDEAAAKKLADSVERLAPGIDIPITLRRNRTTENASTVEAAGRLLVGKAYIHEEDALDKWDSRDDKKAYTPLRINQDLDVENLGRFNTKAEAQAAFDANPMAQTPLAAIHEVWGNNDVEIEEAGGEIRISGKDAKVIKSQLESSLGMEYNKSGKYWSVKTVDARAKIRDGALERYKDTRTSLQKASVEVAPSETSVDEATAALMEAAGLDVGDAVEATTEQAEQPTAAPVETEQAKPEQAAEEAPAEQPAESTANSEQAERIDDFGEKLEGARKDMPKALTDEVNAADIFSKPLSKIWPADTHEKIEDDLTAALVFAARAEIPAKPRTPRKVQRWVDKVGTLLDLVRDPAKTLQVVEKGAAYPGLENFFAKVKLLSQLPRDTWGRVSRVAAYPEAVIMRSDEELAAAGFHQNELGIWMYTTPAGTEASVHFGMNADPTLRDRVYKPTPSVRVTIDGRTEVFEGVGKIGPDQVEAVRKKLGKQDAPTKGALTAKSFEVWGYKNRSDAWYISKKGDPERRVLKEFKGETAVRDAKAFLKSNLGEVVAEWEAVKARDNIAEKEARRDANRERKGVERRGGKDVTEQMFTESFGFRGVQFGNWVSQGRNAKERQGMLNQAFDALHDLADVLGIPSQAISLNGSVGLAFGARGSGQASAHFEPDTLVINLTKTRGAGSLAHEWFHAMDNYFSRMRGERRGYITYAPSTTARLTSNKNFVLPKKGEDSGVRTEVESAFTTLVSALNDSPMTARAKAIDKSQNGYWSRTIERAARSFENYIISKMNERGWSNDYLANIRNFEEWREIGKNAERYPYLLAEEEAPIVAAYDALFDTIETKQDPDTGGTIMFRMEQSQIDNIMRAGMVLANNFFAKGGRSFGDFQKSIQEKFGNKFDAYIPTWYEEAASLQQAEKKVKKDEVTSTAEIRQGIGAGVGEEESRTSARERTDERGRVLPDAGRSRPTDVRGLNEDGRGKRPPLRVAQAQLIPDVPQVVRGDTYSKANGIVLGNDQVLAVNLAIDAFERGRPAFLLADGAGVGKTMVMLATADQFRKRSKTESRPRILIIGQNRQSIQTRFTEDAKALGVSTSGFRFETYSGLAKMVKEGAVNWDLVVFDEAHNLKNADSQRSMAAARLQSPHKLFATATPIDKPTGAAYFMAELTGKTEQEVALALGYRIEEQRDEKTGRIVSRPVLLENVSWHKVWANIKMLRNAAIADGTMVRREFPFYGKADLSEKTTLTEAQRSTDNLIDGYFESLIEDTGGSPTARRNYSGQRTLTWGRANEYRKVPQAVELAEKALREGKQVIIVAETDKMQSFPVQVEEHTDVQEFFSEDMKRSWTRWYRPGAISHAEALLVGRGITDISHIHDTKNNVVADEMRKFQSGENRVVLMTPQSGGTSIDLDDKSGGKPRMMIILSKNFAGDQFEQVLYRVSRRNTASPAEVVFLENDGTSDSIRNDILDKKLGTLRAIQGDTDIDDAVGLNTGDAEVGTIRFRTADQVAQEFTETEQRIGGRKAFDKAKTAGKTALNYRQWVQVRTPAFKAWFGDWEGDPDSASKVVNPETGEPLVVYHNTNAEFWEFDAERQSGRDEAFYFSSSRRFAGQYGGNVMEVFVNLRNPLDYITSKESDLNDGFWVERGTEWDEIGVYAPNQIKSATANDGSFSDQTGDIRFRAVTDHETLSRLNKAETFKAYRAMQVINGELYPAMSAKADGEFRQPSQIGVWEEAVEQPGAVKQGKFALDKAQKGASKMPVAYNPYIHASNSPLNDQFASAYKRDNLVVVEVEIPTSELTSGYRAEGAKDAVGAVPWRSGPVASKLSGDNARQVYLTRWAKPVRIVPDSEVARMVKDMLDGTDIAVPSGVVHPSLLSELKKAGVLTQESDIRFRAVSPEQDAAYMDAVERGDMETAERMVLEAARAAGYSVQVYHGSDNAGFWVFRTAESDGVFATDSQDVARGYSAARDAELADWRDSYMSPVRSHPKYFKRGARPGTYSLMAKLGKSLRVDADGASWSNLPASNGLTRRSIYSYELTKDNANGFMPLLRIKEVYNNKQAAPTIIEEYARTMGSPISLEEEAEKSRGDAMWQLSVTPLGDWDAAYSNDDDSFIISASIPFSTIDEYNNFARQHISPYAVLLGRDLVEYEGKRYSPEDIKRARENRIFVKPHEWRDFTPSIKLLNNINTRKVADFARNNGYDSAVIENVIDNGPNMHDGGSLVPHTVYWFRDSSSLKMANLATYDDAGDVIPLSERFNKKSDDIRFRAVEQQDFGPDFRPGRRHFSTKAHIADLLIRFGLEPYTVKDRITNQSTLDEALAIVKERPDEASVIMLNLRNSKRPATPVERTILLLEVPGITEGLEQASAAMNEATVGTREHDSATARFEAYANKAAELSEVMGMAGTAAGQALQAIKIGVFDDFSLAGMMAAASKANNYQPLTPDQVDFVKQFYDEYSKDKAEFERRMGKEKRVGQTLQDLKREARKRKLSPDNYMDRARTLLERKLDAQGGDITKGDLSSVLQMIARAIVTEDPSIQTDPFNVELHKRFFDLVGTIFPDLTQAETESLFSGYGQIQYPSSEEVDVRLRQLRELDRLRSQLRDVEEGDAPLRTGKQRDDSTHEARELQKKINALMKEMGIVSDDPKRQIKTPLDALKQRIRNRIEDLEHAIRNPHLRGLVDNSIPMELDDEAKSLKDRRDFLQKIYNDIFNKPDDDAKRLKTALKIAQRNLEHAKQRLERAKVGDFSREAKRESVTSAELESLRQQRDSINALIEQLQEEMAPEINAEKRLQRWRKSVHQRMAMYDERIENEDFAKKPVNVRTLSEEDYKLHRKLENKKREFTRKMEAWREENQPLPAKIVSRVRKTSELVKAIRASYDWSALGRQGLWSSLAHPVLAAKAINQMARATFSQINADRYFDEMQLDPDFQRAEQARLALVDPSADAAFMEKEESFTGRIQRFGGKAGDAFFAGIDASDRAYSTFLNFMRFEMFKSILRQHPAGNPTLQELKVIGHFVNAATGRGDITSNPQFAKGLSAILWAPRLQMSRIQMMLGEPIARAALHKESWATKAISKEYGRMMLGTGIIGLIAWLFASLFNDDDDPRPSIGLDPRSTQFGKVRYGDQFLDLTGGAGQMVVLGTKIITGERKTKYGQVVDLRGPNKGYKESTWSEITSALRGKLLPIIGLSFDLVEGESMVGEPTRNLPYVARSLLVPLGIDQMIETAVEDGWAPGMLVGAAELLGFSASNYQTEIFRFVERDYMSASKAWRDAKTQQERDAVLLRAPFLKNKGQLDAIRSRINKIKRTMKRYEEGGLDTTPLENQLAQAQAQFHQIMVEANK